MKWSNFSLREKVIVSMTAVLSLLTILNITMISFLIKRPTAPQEEKRRETITPPKAYLSDETPSEMSIDIYSLKKGISKKKDPHPIVHELPLAERTDPLASLEVDVDMSDKDKLIPNLINHYIYMIIPPKYDWEEAATHEEGMKPLHTPKLHQEFYNHRKELWINFIDLVNAINEKDNDKIATADKNIKEHSIKSNDLKKYAMTLMKPFNLDKIAFISETSPNFQENAARVKEEYAEKHKEYTMMIQSIKPNNPNSINPAQMAQRELRILELLDIQCVFDIKTVYDNLVSLNNILIKKHTKTKREPEKEILHLEEAVSLLTPGQEKIIGLQLFYEFIFREHEIKEDILRQITEKETTIKNMSQKKQPTVLKLLQKKKLQHVTLLSIFNKHTETIENDIIALTKDLLGYKLEQTTRSDLEYLQSYAFLPLMGSPDFLKACGKFMLNYFQSQGFDDLRHQNTLKKKQAELFIKHFF